MKKLLPIVIILAVIGTGGAVFYANRSEKEPAVTTLQMSRGNIIDGVGATGTLQAVTTVTVGTQVSGIVQDLANVDFNSIVKKGQVIARLDPSILETQVETAKANLANANANLERQKVAVDDAQAKFNRAKELAARQLINQVDLENAEVTVRTAAAQLKSTQSSIVQAEAAVNKAKVDLDHTIITAPIDGIVIKRSVDRGQTVNAGMSAPELFIIAADLTKMQVNANIDESDVGRMRPGQDVTFRVDAYPNDTFHGTVKQVRLNPVTVQNVVTYSTVIDVPNPELKLKPGMTAQVTIEIARRQNVLRVPNAALRFRPTKDVFDALHQAMPPELERGFGRGSRGGQQNASGGAPASGQPGAAPQPAGSATPGQASAIVQQNQQRAGATASQGGERRRGAAPDGTPSRGGFGSMTPEERQKRMEERMASMTPEERAQFQERMRQRQAEGGRSGHAQGGARNAQGNAGGSRRGELQGQVASTSKSAATTSATTIDALFAPLPPVETRGRVWLYINKQLKPVELRLGISDGTYTEVMNDATELQPNTEVVTAVITPEMASRPANQQQNNNANNPLMPQRGRPGGPGGRGR